LRRTLSIVAVALTTLFFTSCRKKGATSQEIDVANRVTQRQAVLFFEGPDSLLAPEQRQLALPEKDSAAISIVLRELLKGSANQSISPLMPPGIQLRGAYLLPEGTCVIDLGGDPLTNGWNTGTHAEIVAVYGMVQTVCENFHSVQRVRLLVNGQVAETLAGHIDIAHPLRPNGALIRK
jgi:spore germination protein GerM